MHQLIALAAFLILSVGKTRETGIPWHDQLAYVLGSAIGGTLLFLALHVFVYYGAKTLRPKDNIAGFSATRLNYLTFGILVMIISAQLKH